jgi:transcriptional regulator with XRE-family HTH domain
MKSQRLVAHNLRRLRVSRRLSQESLAVDANVDRAYVSRIERGIENPTIKILDRLAHALNAHSIEFFKPIVGNQALKTLPSGRRRARG